MEARPRSMREDTEKKKKKKKQLGTKYAIRRGTESLIHVSSLCFSLNYLNSFYIIIYFRLAELLFFVSLNISPGFTRKYSQ